MCLDPRRFQGPRVKRLPRCPLQRSFWKSVRVLLQRLRFRLLLPILQEAAPLRAVRGDRPSERRALMRFGCLQPIGRLPCLESAFGTASKVRLDRSVALRPKLSWLLEARRSRRFEDRIPVPREDVPRTRSCQSAMQFRARSSSRGRRMEKGLSNALGTRAGGSCAGEGSAAHWAHERSSATISLYLL